MTQVKLCWKFGHPNLLNSHQNRSPKQTTRIGKPPPSEFLDTATVVPSQKQSTQAS